MGQTARILIVDDEPAVRWVLVDLLRKHGHECFEAADGVEALTRLRDLEVDLILCDVVMPKMDGFVLLRDLLPRIHDRIPFVFLTSLDDVGGVETAIQAGAFDYVVKPCREEDLVAAIDRALVARDAWRRSGRPVRLMPGALPPARGSAPRTGRAEAPLGKPALASPRARRPVAVAPPADRAAGERGEEGETTPAPEMLPDRSGFGGFLRKIGLRRRS